MKILTIDRIIKENKVIRNFYFVDENLSEAKPGQFVMLWVPHVISGRADHDVPDQIPMSISSVKEDGFSLTVRKCGKTTAELFKYKIGERVGITGPLGRKFEILGDRVLCVAGGIGAAPLLFLVQKLQGREIHFILGVKTKEELLFQKKLETLCSSFHVTTDDGSCGKKGFASDLVEELCDKHEIGQIYCCGPEIMMYKVFKTALNRNLPAQFSLERHMYCGLGLCGHCAMDGYLVCRDGPVFTSEELKNAKDFGFREVDKTGRKIDI